MDNLSNIIKNNMAASDRAEAFKLITLNGIFASQSLMTPDNNIENATNNIEKFATVDDEPLDLIDIYAIY